MSQLEDSLLFQIVAAGLPEPRREFRFHPPRRWLYDFAWLDASPPLVVDVEGGIYMNGHHVRGSNYEDDLEKHNQASLMSFRVLRFGPKWIADGRALQMIERALKGESDGN